MYMHVHVHVYNQEYCLVFVVLVAASSFHSSRKRGAPESMASTCMCVFTMGCFEVIMDATNSFHSFALVFMLLKVHVSFRALSTSSLLRVCTRCNRNLALTIILYCHSHTH